MNTAKMFQWLSLSGRVSVNFIPHRYSHEYVLRKILRIYLIVPNWFFAAAFDLESLIIIFSVIWMGILFRGNWIRRPYYRSRGNFAGNCSASTASEVETCRPRMFRALIHANKGEIPSGFSQGLLEFQAWVPWL